MGNKRENYYLKTVRENNKRISQGKMKTLIKNIITAIFLKEDIQELKNKIINKKKQLKENDKEILQILQKIIK